MVFAASRESKVFAHSGTLVQVIRFLLKTAIYSSLSFWMMYCVITEILKVKLEKKNCPYSPIAQLGRTYSAASSLSFIVWISMLVTAKMIRLRFLPSSSHVSGLKNPLQVTYLPFRSFSSSFLLFDTHFSTGSNAVLVTFSSPLFSVWLTERQKRAMLLFSNSLTSGSVASYSLIYNSLIFFIFLKF